MKTQNKQDQISLGFDIEFGLFNCFHFVDVLNLPA